MPCFVYFGNDFRTAPDLRPRSSWIISVVAAGVAVVAAVDAVDAVAAVNVAAAAVFAVAAAFCECGRPAVNTDSKVNSFFK